MRLRRILRISKRRRKKKPSRNKQIATLIVVGALLLTITIATIVSYMGGKFDGLTFVIVALSLMIVFTAAAIVLSLPSVKGKIGEARVSRKLKKLAKKNGGQIFDNVIIPGENDNTSQIDHIYVCKYGVFVVETKNYAGRIYGTDGQLEWTQVLAYGHSKNKLYNPVKQNGTHIMRLSDILNLDVTFYSVVVFVKANIDNVDSDYVYRISDLKYLLHEMEEELNENQVEEICNIINEYKLHPVKTDKEHVKEVKQMQRDIAHNICPRCGGELVLRHGTNGDFYGCSNYPKCKFTKKK